MKDFLLNHKTQLILTVTALLLLMVRAYNFPAWLGFDYDQEINAQIAREIIVNHKLTLIGPETSVGGMYVGPLYNYLIAIFYFLGNMNPASAIVLNLLISFGTGIFCFILARLIFKNDSAGIFATLIYSFSRTMIEFDRVVWNPTPMVFVTLGLLYFLGRYLEEHRLWQLFWAVVFVGFSLQLHFTALFLVALFFLTLIFFGKKKFWSNSKAITIVIVVFLAFISPLIFFDLRHNLLNSRHLLQFLFSSNISAIGGSAVNPLFKVPIILVNFFRATFFKEPNIFLNFASIITLVILLVLMLKNIIQKKSPTIWVLALLFLIYIAGLTFYRGSLPSQYFLPVFGMFTIFLGGILGYLWQRGWFGKSIVTILLTTFIFVNVPPILNSIDGLSLQHKKEAVDYITKQAGAHSFRVEFITAPGRKTGFTYLFWLDKALLVENSSIKTDQVYKIIVPYFLVSPKELSATFGGVGVIKNEQP